jgi:hypothetical protein
MMIPNIFFGKEPCPIVTPNGLPTKELRRILRGHAPKKHDGLTNAHVSLRCCRSFSIYQSSRAFL